MKTGAIVVVLAGLLAGCSTVGDLFVDTAYGVSRNRPLTALPELACVHRAIEVTNGVATVSYRARHEGKGLFHPTPWVYDYVYSGVPQGAVWGSLQFVQTYDGRVTYYNNLLGLKRPPPQSSVDATRPVMRAMEKNIAARCGITELTADIREDCTGVTCNPLPN